MGLNSEPSHLYPQVSGDDVVGPAGLHLSVGCDRVHGQGRKGGGGLGHQDDNHGQKNACLSNDEG